MLVQLFTVYYQSVLYLHRLIYSSIYSGSNKIDFKSDTF